MTGITGLKGGRGTQGAAVSYKNHGIKFIVYQLALLFAESFCCFSFSLLWNPLWLSPFAKRVPVVSQDPQEVSAHQALL